MKRQAKESWAAVVTGLANGLFGGGGGMLAVPALLKLDFDQHRAQATAMAAILPLTLVTAIAYVWRLGVGMPAVWAALGALPGGWLGAHVMGRMRSVWLSRAFAVAALAAGLRMLFA